MQVVTITDEELYQLIEEKHNPPVINSTEDEQSFQSEIKAQYRALTEALLSLGTEGDHYGESDFAIRPDLKEVRSPGSSDCGTPPPAQAAVAQEPREVCAEELQKSQEILNALLKRPSDSEEK